VARNSTTKIGPALLLAVALAGCRHGPPPTPAIGEAYVGPGVLKIRSDISLQSSTVATVKHGERLEILTRRRRFLRVRTASHAEGWTDERQLLAAEDMADLRNLAARAAKMPVQGQGTTYSEVNVHTQPARSSPSFFQIKEKEKVDVLMHVVTPRADAPRKPLLPPPPKKPKAAPKKTVAKEPKYPPPPMPKPPGLPPNWEELSKTPRSDDEDPPVEEEVNEKPVLPRDEWSLVRNRDGQSGWILTRRLVMAIPDEVAQYAEGRHIVSYFSLGQLRDGDVNKPIWLWTTIGKGDEPYDFDSFRVFTWSLRHHRYETAHIERNVRGYSPVLLKEVDFSAASKSRSEAASGKYPGFSICMENRDGQRVRREFALLTNVVRYAGELPCEAAAPIETTLKPPSVLKTAPEPVTPPQPTGTAFERFKTRVRGWFGKK
jgi:uncharacterized protein YgiM (DUF1202 family)